MARAMASDPEDAVITLQLSLIRKSGRKAGVES